MVWNEFNGPFDMEKLAILLFRLFWKSIVTYTWEYFYANFNVLNNLFRCKAIRWNEWANTVQWIYFLGLLNYSYLFWLIRTITNSLPSLSFYLSCKLAETWAAHKTRYVIWLHRHKTTFAYLSTEASSIATMIGLKTFKWC